MQRTKPPYRADHVGSLLRSAPLKQARARRERGEITAADLREIEDREIEKIVRKQEEIGLKLATDGEYRRSWWHFDFLEKLDGVEGFLPEHGIQFHGVETKPKAVRVVGKIRFIGWPEKRILPTTRTAFGLVSTPWNWMPCSGEKPSTPSSFSRKSKCHHERRYSPSVASFSPISSCLRTIFSISRSSISRKSAAVISPRSRLARACLSGAERSRLPTWSAR